MSSAGLAQSSANRSSIARRDAVARGPVLSASLRSQPPAVAASRPRAKRRDRVGGARRAHHPGVVAAKGPASRSWAADARSRRPSGRSTRDRQTARPDEIAALLDAVPDPSIDAPNRVAGRAGRGLPRFQGDSRVRQGEPQAHARRHDPTELVPQNENPVAASSPRRTCGPRTSSRRSGISPEMTRRWPPTGAQTRW